MNTTRHPDRCPTHPGIFLRDITLPEIENMSKVAIAANLEISRNQLYKILNGESPVLPELAVRLEALFGGSAQTWLNMQAAHDIWHARRKIDTSELNRISA